MAAALDDLLAAFQLLTRLPAGVTGDARPAPDLRRMIWAFPVVGAVVGALGGLAYGVGYGLGCPPMLAAVFALGAQVLVTGAMHEDGLADTADGFGGGATRERKLEIMRDSRIGSYGVIALVLALALRIAAITAVAMPGPVMIVLIAAGSLGRGAIVGLMLMLSPARRDGLASQGAAPDRRAAATGITIACAAALLLLPIGAASAAIFAAALAGLVVAWLARRQIGGHTGDVLGAGGQIAECLVLAVLAAALS